jgi:hypothetical protein
MMQGVVPIHRSVPLSDANVKNEARLTGSARSMQDWGCVSAESFEVGAGQPLLSMRLFGLFESYFRSSCAPRKR